MKRYVFILFGIFSVFLMTGCSGGAARGKWLEIGSTGQLINLDQVRSIVPGNSGPARLSYVGPGGGSQKSGPGYISFFSPEGTITLVEFPSQLAADTKNIQIIEFLKSDDHYLKL